MYNYYVLEGGGIFMLARDYKIGDKFKHINCEVITVVEIDGFKFFENSEGDTFNYIDDSLIFYKL